MANRRFRKDKADKDFDAMIEQISKAKDQTTMSLSACLNRIRIRINSENYNDSVVEELRNDFDYVEKKLGTCPEESAILACVLETDYGFHSCEDDDIASYMGFTNIEFLCYRKYLDSLAEKRIVRISKDRANVSYKVIKEACKAIVEDREFSEKNFAGISTEEMFSHMRIFFKNFRDEEINERMLINDLNMLVDMNPQNIFSQKINEYGIKKLRDTEQRIFYYLCHRFVSFGDQYMNLGSLNEFISDHEDGQRFFRNLQAGKTTLQANGLICFGGEENFMDKSQVGLSEKVRNEMFTEVELFSETVEGHKDLMSYESIVAKELFYNEGEQEQINRLGQLLEEEQFNGIQSRLEEMGMRKGFNIILYGGPGTGKTETTMQLAKKTGRDIFCIDMSKLKSKWVGESEKCVKGVFNTYRHLCKSKKTKPILFFNEADAIFGKRMENVESSAAQMLNTMQNIILQEIEDLEGILIATTNLTQNLDSAFERRFLFKIEFNKPETDVKAKIWSSMLKNISADEATLLASKFDFSGGQIENIARKRTIDYILSGKYADIKDIESYCRNELLENKNNIKPIIGFSA
jgi:ATP-dependent 26S proteasome regulatory subunit